jgi:peptidoglycan/LPS O-acetylase OafA/YrhL
VIGSSHRGNRSVQIRMHEGGGQVRDASTGRREAGRLVQLDGLRAFAVLGVMLHHATHWDFPVPLGPFCVRLFFVLSGFLITGILLKARERGGDEQRGEILKAFYIRRFLRIFPVYYASLAILFALGQPDIRATIGWHAAYLSNVLASRPSGDIVSIWGHLWSLSVEEQFYLAWPALILFLPRRMLPYFLVAAAAVGPLFRLVVASSVGVKPAFYLTPGCLDSLGLGALLAWMDGQRAWDQARSRLCQWALPIGLALTGAMAVAERADLAFRVRCFARDLGPALAFCWLVNGAARGFGGWAGKLLAAKPLTYLGMISYGMYLFHNFLPWVCEYAGAPLPPHGIARFAALVPLTIVTAAASWKFFEKPLNDLKERFPYMRRDLAATPPHEAAAVST